MQVKISLALLKFWRVLCEGLKASMVGDSYTGGEVLRVEIEWIGDHMYMPSLLVCLLFVGVREMNVKWLILGHFQVKSIVNLEGFTPDLLN